MDLKETDILGDHIGRHWYYRSKARAMQRMIGDRPVRSILDVGAGSAFFSKWLMRRPDVVEAWCVDISYDEERDVTEAGKAIHYRRSIERVDADLVLLMDVLEHVDDDVGLLRSYVEKVPTGSSVLMTVPAFRFMWSEHDVFLDHRRRYTLPQLERVAQEAGLEVIRGAYFFGALFPVAAVTRLFARPRADRPPRSQLKRHHPWVNAVLTWICSLELPLMSINRLVGLSAFCVAVKR